MKLTLIITTAIIGALGAGMASADTTPMDNCERIDMGGYFNLVDPTCEFDTAGSDRDNDAPADLPPVVTPPEDDDDEPVDEPPVDEPPVDEPPVDEPPVDEPPVDEPAPVEEH